MSTNMNMNQPENPSPQKGAAIMIIVLLLAMLAFIPVIMQLTVLSSVKTQQQVQIGLQSDNIARAGITDAVEWFRRQPVQPVWQNSKPYPDAAFNPVYNTDPALSDTIDASIGIVRAYPLTEDNKLWARYEVKKQGNGLIHGTTDSHAVHDITTQRTEGFLNGDGLAWSIESIGYVYSLADPTTHYNTPPNRVISKSRASTEIRRVAVNLPLDCALITNNINSTSFYNNVNVLGQNSVGIGYYQGTAPNVFENAGYTGSPATMQISTNALGLDSIAIFGLSNSDLKQVADYSVKTVSELPSPYPSESIVYIDGNVTFLGGSQPKLVGGGLLFVNGNLTLGSYAYHSFSGIIYVTGNLTVGSPSTLSGSVCVEGFTVLSGTNSWTEINYDPGVINAVRQKVSQYRENKSTYFNFSGLK